MVFMFVGVVRRPHYHCVDYCRSCHTLSHVTDTFVVVSSFRSLLRLRPSLTLCSITGGTGGGGRKGSKHTIGGAGRKGSNKSASGRRDGKEGLYVDGVVGGICG